MIRIAQSSSRLASQRAIREFSSKSRLGVPPDQVTAAFHYNHKISQFLAVAAPFMFLMPESWTQGAANKAFGVLVAANISFHSWVGINAVASDYVPKLDKKYLPHARVFNASLAGLILIGLGRVALSDPGITGTLKGLWNPPKKDKNTD